MEVNKDVRLALKELSHDGLALKTSNSISEIDDAHARRRSYYDILRGFERTRSRSKDLQTQRLRTERAWKKLTAAERRFIKDHARRVQGGEHDNSG